MQYRLIALDLDGTLLNSRKDVSPRTRAALAAARERGLVTVVATGRGPHSARHYSRLIGGGPIVCCNGAAVLDETGAFLSTKGIPTAPLRRCLELCREAGVLVECYTPRGIALDRPLAQMIFYVNWVRPRLSWPRTIASLVTAWRTNHMFPVANLLKWLEKPGQVPVLKLMIVGQETVLPALARRISEEAPGLSVTSSGADNLEVMATGISKAAGLQVLGARRQIPAEAMIAFGDSNNDLEMLGYAGVGVAMGNARDDVKAIANRIAPSNDEDGVAQVIEELCLR